MTGDVFENIIDEPKEKVNYQKTNFLTVIPGQNVIVRLLGKAIQTHTHYLGKSSVACLGDECPICMNNKRLIVENPEDFRNAKGWSFPQRRFLANVLDRTPVKVCSNCQTENRKSNGKYMPTCYSCGTFITNEPEVVSNKVKVYSFGPTIKDELVSKRVHPITGEEHQLSSFDFALSATGTGKEKKTSVTPIYERNDVVEVPEDALFDLENVTIKLKADEMLQLQRGVSLKDIFTARKNKQTPSEDAESSLSSDVLDDVKKSIDDFFNV